MKRMILCALSAGLLSSALLAPAAMASIQHVDGAKYIVSVDGTMKGGFTETWDDGSVVYVPTLGKQHKDCAHGASDMSYCMGMVDGRMTEELELKMALLRHE